MQCWQRYQRAQQGFTLIELMAVVVIVAVLLAVALPAYQKQVIRGKRAAAQSEMLAIANIQQQYLLSNRAYMDTSLLTSIGYALDPDVSKNYTMSIVLGTQAVPSYDLTFTPIGSQTSDGPLTLDEQGVGTPSDKWDR